MATNRIRWQEHIEVPPDLHHNDPCIKDTRIPVKIITGSLADGMTPEEIMAAYPQLTGANILAARRRICSESSLMTLRTRGVEVRPLAKAGLLGPLIPAFERSNGLQPRRSFICPA